MSEVKKIATRDSYGNALVELGKEFDMTGATLSHHLSMLKKAGLVQDQKKGTFIYYEINTSVMEDLLSWVVSFMGDKDEQ